MRLSEAEGRVATATAAAEEVREALALRSREPQVVEAPTPPDGETAIVALENKWLDFLGRHGDEYR